MEIFIIILFTSKYNLFVSDVKFCAEYLGHKILENGSYRKRK